MPEIFRTSLPTDHPQEELRLTLFSASEDQVGELWRFLTWQGQSISLTPPARQVTLPLVLWPRFHAAVCCLGAFMKPLPAPAYQARSCCSYVCPPTPETVVLGEDPQEQIHLSLQDRRGSTFLEIKAVEPFSAGINPGAEPTILIGPTRWSAFLFALQRLDQIISNRPKAAAPPPAEKG